MDNRIQLTSDGEGILISGEQQTDIDEFLESEGLLSVSTMLGSPDLALLLHAGAGVAQAGSEIAATSGRWLKLTKESSRLVEKYGLTESSTPGVRYAMVGKPGRSRSWLEVEKGVRSLRPKPAMLSGAAGVMTQLARQQEMHEIRNYLATIDEKVDDVLDAQKDAELARVVGAGFDIESAMTLREQTGRLDATTWSTVQSRMQTITDALGWALRRLSTLARKVESTSKIGDLARTAGEAESEVRELLAVVAHCFELQDAFDVLRLDRIMDESPDELDALRLALEENRQSRRERISEKIEHLMARLDAAAGTANSQVLLHPSTSRAAVGSINEVGSAVEQFHRLLGLDSDRESLEARRWRDAAKNVALGAKEAVGTAVVKVTRR